MTDLKGARWRKSARSSGSGNCVEVATNLVGVVAVRDSKDVAGPALMFTPGDWHTFLTTAKQGTFDHT